VRLSKIASFYYLRDRGFRILTVMIYATTSRRRIALPRLGPLAPEGYGSEARISTMLTSSQGTLTIHSNGTVLVVVKRLGFEKACSG
jgi:hypothetical protein